MKELNKISYSKFFLGKDIKEIDNYTITNEPIDSADLMERAAKCICKKILKLFKNNLKYIIVSGKGNNGGDGIALTKFLLDKKKEVKLFIVGSKDHLSKDSAVNADRLLGKYPSADITYITSSEDLQYFDDSCIIVDALFGTGLSRPVEGLYAEVIRQINDSKAKVIALDIPSGLMTEDNSHNNYDHIVKANYTITIEFPKLSFLFPENEKYIGQLFVVSIGLHPDIIHSQKTPFHLIRKDDILPKIKTASDFSYKNTFGHALLIAGSYGKMGAAVLAAKSVLRGGAGLLTVHIPRSGYNIIQTAIPEAMVSVDSSETIFSDVPDIDKYNAIGIGPGIGTANSSCKALKSLILNANKPMVIDADAINIIASHPAILKDIPKGSIITPHIGEFSRLAGECNDSRDRLQKQIKMSQEFNIIIVLKGTYTSVSLPDGNVYFNTTGNWGMATAGSGDVLTGIILSLLTQGYSPVDAAVLGVYLHGYAGDIAASKRGKQSLISGDIADFMCNAFKKLSK